jgi:hypothetical protein
MILLASTMAVLADVLNDDRIQDTASEFLISIRPRDP